MQKVFLTTKELAHRWGVSQSKINHMRMDESAELPFYIFGRSVRYRLDDIEQYEAEGKQ
jgi:excisionase family DNA binding protein